jgi:type IV pilus assembly protein PilX
MALVFVLIMISIIFVIAAVSSRVVTLGERAARNDRDRQTAFQAAEAALSDAEIDIMGARDPETHVLFGRVTPFGSLPGSGCSAAAGGPVTRDADAILGFCDPLPDRAYKTLFKDDDNSTRYWASFGEFTGRGNQLPVGSAGLPARSPRYIIEKSLISYRNRAETVGKPFDAFIITAIGYGLTESTQVVLQAVISKPVPTNN